MFIIATVFIKAKKTPKNKKRDKPTVPQHRVNKLWHIHMIKYYSAKKKKNKLLTRNTDKSQKLYVE